MSRSSGILLHLTSLPGPFGIGKFGPEVLQFARILADCGFRYWQVLPFGPPAAGDSPYQCYSAFAGNPLLIDPRQLAEQGLLTIDELERCQYDGPAYSCDFPWLAQTTDWVLRRAFSNAVPGLLDLVARWQEEPEQAVWINDYALFQAIRLTCEESVWWEWPDEQLRRHDPAALARFAGLYADEIQYQVFVQYCFFQQWQDLKTAINLAGVQIIGDMPIYVARDSSDVWAGSQYFELDENLVPKRVAGVPPDYFASEGQLWGNPLYDWPRHAGDGYAWWLERLASALRLFDRVRLDHFRGFVTYWAVPADAATAKSGSWCPGPAHDLFDRIFERFAPEAIIAEDLGDVDEAVRQFLLETGLPGMRVMQFGFDPDDASTHLPCFYPENCVAYTGTHDNNTLLGWLWEASPAERSFALRYAGIDAPGFDWGQGGPAAPAVRALLRILWATAASLAVAPLQDLLGYGQDTRLNKPGESTGQWRFRFSEHDIDRLDQAWLAELNRTYRRDPESQKKSIKQSVPEFGETP